MNFYLPNTALMLLCTIISPPHYLYIWVCVFQLQDWWMNGVANKAWLGMGSERRNGAVWMIFNISSVMTKCHRLLLAVYNFCFISVVVIIMHNYITFDPLNMIHQCMYIHITDLLKECKWILDGHSWKNIFEIKIRLFIWDKLIKWVINIFISSKIWGYT